MYAHDKDAQHTVHVTCTHTTHTLLFRCSTHTHTHMKLTCTITDTTVSHHCTHITTCRQQLTDMYQGVSTNVRLAHYAQCDLMSDIMYNIM